MSGKKTNPNKIPRTEADCKREYLRGIGDGVRLSRAIMLSVLLDKYNAQDHIIDVWHDFEKLSVEIKEGRVNIIDLERVLLEEYHIECK
jgi:hypothetical protein